MSCEWHPFTASTADLLIQSSVGGVVRGGMVHGIIYPLQVMKVRQQCDPRAKTSQIFWSLFQKEGPTAFYAGFSHQLLQTSLKQLWCWPMMTGLPLFFEQQGVEKREQQICTGITIATIDALTTLFLERHKLQLAAGERRSSFWKNKEGWRGYSTHWSRLSINWVVFLTAQHHLRERAHRQNEGPLSLPQLLTIGTQVAFLVSVASAPFDFANTRKQVQNVNLSASLRQGRASLLYRGWPFYALSLTIHNVASVFLLETLQLKTLQKD